MKVYQENIKKYAAKTLRLKKVLNRVSLLRLSIFVISGAILITLFSVHLITPIFIVFPVSVICFALAVKHYNKIAYLRKHSAFLKKINESEIQREKCTLEEFDAGHQFINQNHPYISDLDIFGIFLDNIPFFNCSTEQPQNRGGHFCLNGCQRLLLNLRY